MRKDTQKKSKVSSSTFYIKWGLTQVSKPSESYVIPVLQVFGRQSNVGELGSSTPHCVKQHTKSNKKLQILIPDQSRF